MAALLHTSAQNDESRVSGSIPAAASASSCWGRCPQAAGGTSLPDTPEEATMYLLND